MTERTHTMSYMRLENNEYLSIDCFQCGFDCLVLFDQLYGSFWSDSTQRIAVVTAKKDTQINELNTVISTSTVSVNTSREMEKLCEIKLVTEATIKFSKGHKEINTLD